MVVADVAGTLSGGCFCGAVTYEIKLPTLGSGHCHCSMCRRISGAAYVTWTSVPIEQLKVNGAENLARFDSGTSAGKDSPVFHGYRRFCKKCSSPLFCDDTEDDEHKKFTSVSMATINHPEKLDKQPNSHGFWTDRATWASVNPDDGLKRYRTPKKFEPGVQTGGNVAGDRNNQLPPDRK